MQHVIYAHDFVSISQETIAKEPIVTSTVTASSACTVDTIPPMTPLLERMEKPMELQGAMEESMEELELPGLQVMAVWERDGTQINRTFMLIWHTSESTMPHCWDSY
jgi:hypothetical protein